MLLLLLLLLLLLVAVRVVAHAVLTQTSGSVGALMGPG
jgi:hypothetical protein